LPSPEELEKQREKNRKELSDLSERLREENLEREQRQREEEFRQAQILYFRSGSQVNQGAYNGNGYYSNGFIGGYPYLAIRAVITVITITNVSGKTVVSGAAEISTIRYFRELVFHHKEFASIRTVLE
jgi:hypothetical protein